MDLKRILIMKNDDIALEVFLERAQIYAPDISKELLLKVYESQKRHQFDDEKSRNASVSEIEKLVEAYLDENNKGV